MLSVGLLLPFYKTGLVLILLSQEIKLYFLFLVGGYNIIKTVYNIVSKLILQIYFCFSNFYYCAIGSRISGLLLFYRVGMLLHAITTLVFSL